MRFLNTTTSEKFSEIWVCAYNTFEYSCHGNNCFCGFYSLDICSGNLFHSSHLLLKSTLRDCNYWIIWFFLLHKMFLLFCCFKKLSLMSICLTLEEKKMCNSKVYNVGSRLLKQITFFLSPLWKPFYFFPLFFFKAFEDNLVVMKRCIVIVMESGFLLCLEQVYKDTKNKVKFKAINLPNELISYVSIKWFKLCSFKVSPFFLLFFFPKYGSKKICW